MITSSPVLLQTTVHLQLPWCKQTSIEFRGQVHSSLGGKKTLQSECGSHLRLLCSSAYLATEDSERRRPLSRESPLSELWGGTDLQTRQGFATGHSGGDAVILQQLQAAHQGLGGGARGQGPGYTPDWARAASHKTKTTEHSTFSSDMCVYMLPVGVYAHCPAASFHSGVNATTNSTNNTTSNKNTLTISICIREKGCAVRLGTHPPTPKVGLLRGVCYSLDMVFYRAACFKVRFEYQIRLHMDKK